ncbi:MAG: class I SAM-dependent methyltransferase [Oligoflexales bacterium]
MAKSRSKGTAYLHGFSREEQDRLKRQARFAEFAVFQNVNFSEVKNLLEVGVGVGAQTEIILRRFPEIKITGIDKNKKQLETARKFLEELPLAKGRFKIEEMDAHNLDYAPGTFDGAFLCWVLEHIPEPVRVLSEVRRVLKPNAPVVITEVMNHTFFLDPYSPNVWKYWMAFNDFQYEHAGDPFIGAKLGNLLMSQGFKDIQSNIKTWLLDNREPAQRKRTIDYWTELLLSAADKLIEAKYITPDLVKKCTGELKAVATDPNAVFYFSFMQVMARTA